MRIGIQRNAIGAQFIYLGQGAVKGLGRLLRQAINQINVDGFKADLAGRRHQGKDLRCRLNAVYCFLHFGVKVLHAKTQAIETQLKQKSQAFFVDCSGVYFHRILTAGRQAKAAFEHGHEFAQLFVA